MYEPASGCASKCVASSASIGDLAVHLDGNADRAARVVAANAAVTAEEAARCPLRSGGRASAACTAVWPMCSTVT
jgi:hypothetical protein